MIRYVMIILCIISFGGCRRSPEMKWYHHVLDSLGRIEAPLRIDTLIFNKQLVGRESIDTMMNNTVIYQYRDYYSQNYVRHSRHKDSLIVDRYEYNSSDGLLISWSRHFPSAGNIVGNGSIVDYTKWYKKSGKIKTFGAEELGYEPSPWQNYTIYHLINRLHKEGVDLKNDVVISRSYTDPPTILNFGEISYPKLNWIVKVYYFDDCYRNFASVHCREFDSDTGELVKEWRESSGIE